MLYQTIPVFSMLTAFDGKIAELMGVTSSVRKSSRFLIDWSKGFLERLCIVISIGLPHFSASLRTALNSLDSETNLPTSSTNIKSDSSIAF